MYTSNGEFTVPESVTQIFITACAAGGDGVVRQPGPSGAGLAGDFVIEELVNVKPKEKIDVTVGSGNTIIGGYITLIANSIQINLECDKLGYKTGLAAEANDKSSGNAPSGALGYGGGNGAYKYEYYSNQRECTAGTALGVAHGKRVALGGTGNAGGIDGGDGFLMGSGAGGSKHNSYQLTEKFPGGGGAGGYGAGGGAPGGYTYGGGVTDYSGNPGQGSPGIVIIEW